MSSSQTRKNVLQGFYLFEDLFVRFPVLKDPNLILNQVYNMSFVWDQAFLASADST